VAYFFRRVEFLRHALRVADKWPKSFVLPFKGFFPPCQQRDMQSPKLSCANIKNRKHPTVRCNYPAVKGEFCSRHYKNPHRFGVANSPIATRSVRAAAMKIKNWWKLRQGLKLARERSPAFFARELCNNETEVSNFEPLNTVPRDYFFVIKEKNIFWGFDIRSLLVQYEAIGSLENIYTKQSCDPATLEAFRIRLSKLKAWKKSLALENTMVLSAKQSWSLRVLDVCLRLDMLGYRIATQWFSDLDIFKQKALYGCLFRLWNEQLTEDLRKRIVPENSQNKLFKFTVDKIIFKSDLDSIRRNNLNIIERLISSASEQSDKTLGAMYTVMCLAIVSPRTREAYPWLV
jgi:hypothetical protein